MLFLNFGVMVSALQILDQMLVNELHSAFRLITMISPAKCTVPYISWAISLLSAGKCGYFPFTFGKKAAKKTSYPTT